MRFETEPGRQMQADFATLRRGEGSAGGVHRDARLEPDDVRRVRYRRADGDEDLMGSEVDIELPGFAVGTDYVKFRAKARAFLREHLDRVAIHKLRMNRPLTESDLRELQRMLAESGFGGAGDVRCAAEESQGLGLFVRSLVGLDRGAAKDAMTGFIAGKALSANQIEFINLIVDHLTEHGTVEPSALYESPFTDLTPRGPDVLFTPAQVDELMRALEAARATAVAA